MRYCARRCAAKAQAGPKAIDRAGRHARQARDRAARFRCQQIYPATSYARSLRSPARRSRISSGLASNCSTIALEAGLHSSPWADPKPGAHVARAAGTYMLGQIESGVYCPLAMTYGSVPTLRHAPANRGRMAAANFFARLRSPLSAGTTEDFGPCRHGHDREPGRLGPAHQYDTRGACPPTAVSACMATNGSCRRRCAMRSLFLRSRRKA